MKPVKYIFFLLLLTPFLFSCDEEDEDEDEEPERTTHLVTFNNNRGSTGGCFPGYTVDFLVTYRDIQASLNLPAGGTGFLNVLVEDNESINVQVIKISDDQIVADANVNVRTTSRPDNLEGEFRTVNFCDAFDLNFNNF
ncbi:MAG: hypothetical protein KUG68_00880 [Flavobacteriaceae bacterium]|nr:hypothetical protein [Flavobacteriaceae bacterium]